MRLAVLPLMEKTTFVTGVVGPSEMTNALVLPLWMMATMPLHSFVSSEFGGAGKRVLISVVSLSPMPTVRVAHLLLQHMLTPRALEEEVVTMPHWTFLLLMRPY